MKDDRDDPRISFHYLCKDFICLNSWLRWQSVSSFHCYISSSAECQFFVYIDMQEFLLRNRGCNPMGQFRLLIFTTSSRWLIKAGSHENPYKTSWLLRLTRVRLLHLLFSPILIINQWQCHCVGMLFTHIFVPKMPSQIDGSVCTRALETCWIRAVILFTQ